MKFDKAPADGLALFARAIPADPRVERRKMFGYDAAFINGHMFAGTWATGVIVKLPIDEVRAQILEGAQAFDPMGGRVMRAFALLSWKQCADEDFLRDRLARSLAFVTALPPKPKKAPKSGKNG